MKDEVLLIEDGVLEECTDKSATSVEIPDGVEEIGRRSFLSLQKSSSLALHKERNEGFFALDDYSADVCFILRACRLIVLRLFVM
ncbi:MAG: hypothetical protein K6B43_14120 [Treponema sp.]|nr:hypothetical protein [Treponema sp.]